MTQPDVTLRPYEAYLDLDPVPFSAKWETESVNLYLNLLGPDQSQDVFAMVAALVAAGRTAPLRRLYAGHTALHQAILETGGSRDEELSRRLGPPFQAGEPASLHAMRALAALGLALTEDEPDPDLLRAAITWQKEARGAPAGVVAPWTPAALAGGDPPLHRCLERLAEVADADADADADNLATLTVAATLRRLRRPTVKPGTKMLLSQPSLAAEGLVPARRWRWERPPGLARRARSHAITALVDQGATGTAALLTLTVDGGLPTGLIPDPGCMSLFAADEGFQDAMGRAWRQAGQGRIRSLVTWSAVTADGPLRYAGGESAGAAFAVLLDEARRLARPLAALTVPRRVVSGNAITGRIDNEGCLQGVEGYQAKLGALGEGSRVIVPAVDAEKAKQAAAAARATEGMTAAQNLEIVSATRWKDAAWEARRSNKKVLLGQGLVVALVGALIAAGVALQQRQEAAVTASLALSDQIAGLSESLDHADPVTAARLAAAAWEASPTSQARESLLTVLAQPLRTVLTAGGPFRWAGFSPGRGTVLATVGQSIQLWNAATGRPLGKPIAVPGGASWAAFSPSGAVLATADTDGTARLWDVATGRQAAAPLMASASNGANAVEFSPSGAVLATADGDGTVRLWAVATGRRIGDPLTAGHATTAADQVMDVAFSPDGKLLATADLDGTARLWDVATHRQIGAAMALGHGVSSEREMRRVAFSPDGTTLATVSADGSVLLWSVSSQRQIGMAGVKEEAGTDIAYGHAFGFGGAMLAIADSDGTADLWDAVTRSEITALDAETADSMTSVAVSPDGAMLASVSADGTARLWDLSLFHAIGPSIQYRGLLAVALSPNGRYLATAGFDRTIRVWDLATGQPARAPISMSRTGGVAAITFSPDGKLLAVADDDGTARLLNLATGQPAGAPILVSRTGGVAAITFSPDGKVLATADDDDGNVRLWNLATRHQSGPAIRVTDEVTALDFSPDGAVIATVTVGHSGRLWDARTHLPVSGLHALNGVNDVAFSPDGTTLATAGYDGAVQLWNLATGRAIGQSMVATSLYSVEGVTFSPDGSMLATAGGDGIARLWDVATRHEIGPTMLAADTGSGLRRVVFSPDGTTLATFGPGEAASIWDVAFPPDLLSAACSIAGRPLTQQEWNAYVPSAPYIRAC